MRRALVLRVVWVLALTLALPAAAHAADWLGPVALVLEDARDDVNHDEIQLRWGPTIELDGPVVEQLGEAVARSAGHRGVWLVEEDQLGAETPNLEVAVRLEALDCVREDLDFRCMGRLRVQTGERREGAERGDEVLFGAAGATAREAVGLALDSLMLELDGAWAALADLVALGPPPTPEGTVELMEGPWGSGVVLGPIDGDTCVLSERGEAIEVPPSDAGPRRRVLIPGAMPDRAAVWVRGATEPMAAVRATEAGWLVRVSEGLDLVASDAVRAVVRFGRGAPLVQCRVLDLDLAYATRSRAEEFWFAEARRRAAAKKGQAAWSVGLGLTIAGGLTLASSLLMPIDACFMAHAGCVPNPQARVTAPLGSTMLIVGVPMLAVGGAIWAKEGRR